MTEGLELWAMYTDDGQFWRAYGSEMAAHCDMENMNDPRSGYTCKFELRGPYANATAELERLHTHYGSRLEEVKKARDVALTALESIHRGGEPAHKIASDALWNAGLDHAISATAAPNASKTSGDNGAAGLVPDALPSANTTPARGPGEAGTSHVGCVVGGGHTVIYLKDGSKVRLCRDPDTMGRAWLEHVQQDVISPAVPSSSAALHYACIAGLPDCPNLAASSGPCASCVAVLAAAERAALRKLARKVGRLIAANDRTSPLAPRPDIAWRDVRKAYADLEAAEAAPSSGAARGSK